MAKSRISIAGALLILALLVAGCSGSRATAQGTAPPAVESAPLAAATRMPEQVTPAAAAAPALAAPTVPPTPAPPTPAPPSPVPTQAPTQAPIKAPTQAPTPVSRLSIEYLRQQEYPGSDIVIEQKLAAGSNHDRYIASYLSEGLKIYALLTVPRGQAPATGWPVIVFNHGYIPPSQYRTTERYVAYVNGFATQGYIVFRPDYRGHGNSEGAATGAYGSPGYVIDVLNAVASVKRYPGADPDRIGMWGHSMGGWITLRAMVVSPDIKAGVIWGGVVAAYEDLLEHWRRNRPSATPGATPDATPGASTSRGGWRNSLVAEYGEPDDNLAFWRSLSPNHFLTDLNGPIQLHHARGDASVPVKLSELLYEQGQAAGMPIELFAYPGDNHNISGNFGRAMASSVAFFDRWVKQPANLLEATGPTVYPKVDGVNLRQGPGTNFPVTGQLRIGESLPIVGRSDDGSWWQVQTPDGPAWIAGSVTLAAHTAAVPVASAAAPAG